MFVFKKSPSAISCDSLLSALVRGKKSRNSAGFWLQTLYPRAHSMAKSTGAALSKTEHSPVLFRKVDLRARNAQQSSKQAQLLMICGFLSSHSEVIFVLALRNSGDESARRR
jgi:hypothetical protein